MKKKPKVSIITVCYNSADTIERTIQSVTTQTYSEIEYIVIDGGSTDGTQEKIEKYIDIIAYFCSEPDNGIYDAINKGIRRSSGDIIGILNSDDWYEREAVKMIVNAYDKSASELFYGNINFIDSNCKAHLAVSQSANGLWKGMCLFHPSVFVQRSVYEKVGLFNIQYQIAADYDFLLRCYDSGVKMEYIPEILANFTQNGISTTSAELAIEESAKIALFYAKADKKKEIEQYYHQIMLQRKIPYLYDKLLQKEKSDYIYFRKRIQEIFENKQPIALYSAGKYGIKICTILERNGCEIAYFVDQDIDKNGSVILDKKVYSPEYMKEEPHFTIIANAYHADEIMEELLQKNLVQKENCFSLEVLFEKITDI